MPGPFFTRPKFEDRQVVQYTGSSITLSGNTNISPTGNFRIYKDAFPGLVATSLDADGTVGWGPISGISWSISACTSPLYVNNLVSCPLSAGTIQVDAGALTLNSELQFLISLSAGTNNDDILVIDNNGFVKSIPYVNGGSMWYVPFGYTLTVPDNYQSFVYGDLYVLGTIDLQTNAQLVVLNGNIILSGGSIIGSGTTQLVTLGGGSGCCFTGGTGSCITDLYVTNIHGCSPINIQPTSPNDVYMVMGGGNVGIGTLNPSEKLHVSGDTLINGDSLWLSNNTTNIVPIPSFNGIVVSQDYGIETTTRRSGILTTNSNPSGQTGILMVNNSNANAFITIAGSLDYRGGVSLTGNEFYRNKLIMKGGGTIEGMVFNPAASDPSGTFWWEIDGSSSMVLRGDGVPGSGNAFLGIALNPNGAEMPSSNLQIGGTGTTGTFQYRDGNQQNGYVLTSDSDGNATWQVPTGGGSGTTIVQFTGNTSASCITDLWVTNVHGCSPITVWDSVQSNGSQATGITSFSFGYQTQALGDYSHAEGNFTTASGPNSHSQGILTIASGNGSHAGGVGDTVSKVISSASGSFNHSVVDNTYSGTGASNLGTFILGGFNNSVSKEWCGVIGGQNNDLRGGGIPVPISSVIVGGSNNVIYTGYRSIVLGGNALTGTSNDTVYVPDFVIKRAAVVPTTSTDTVGEIGSITYDDDYLYIKTPRSGGRWGRISLDFAF